MGTKHATENLKRSINFFSKSSKEFPDSKMILNRMSKDRRGYLTLKELGRSPTMEYLIDANGDHKISREEFKQYIKTIFVFTSDASSEKVEQSRRLEKFLKQT